MTAEDLKRDGRALLGYGWQTRLGEMLGVDGSTVRRWVGSGIPIPPTARAFIAMMCERQETRGALVYERQTIGHPTKTLIETTADEYHKLGKPVLFPGVKDPKYMPSVFGQGGPGPLRIALEDGRTDRIETRSVSYHLTRHPDPWHRDGYVAAAAAAGHSATSVKHGDHHYTLIAHGKIRDDAPGTLVIQIATHRNVIRTVVSTTDAPAEIVESTLA